MTISEPSPHLYNVHSMTAFARFQSNADFGRFSWEIRSVNQRYLEVNCKLPDNFRHLEPLIREQIKAHINRGKLDISLSFEVQQNNDSLTVNPDVLDPLGQAIERVQQLLPNANQLNPLEILRWPGLLISQEQHPQQEAIEQKLLEGLDKTINVLLRNRAREGQALAHIIEDRCQQIAQQLNLLEPQLEEFVTLHSDKLRQKIAELTDTIDENRFHQEVAILAQKADITEEIDRLRTHIKEVLHILQRLPVGGEPRKPIGRRLDFLMQELNREANTLGSKATHIEISQTSVELKVLIEQMREQIQNIE
ncbi:YicC/YloC family endoribonuclease [Thiomicrorhabdus sediminis]|uniref:YicC family protein n=1 Tax=Thiomicrorhabdus sediminis TaxID=2580412 RepID=A0A4P9K7E6_9GAMM|nr:YicC/YloC family endoribonuclease [Thiomicrorhabdus sediminis]QCU90969.1 YicC family protein [Thiomicrorhabdus sediminis]